MDALSITYLKLTSRARSWEYAVHAALLTYSLLLCLALFLNMFSPEWVSRNTPQMKASQVRDALPLPTKMSRPNFEAVSRCITRGLLLNKNEDPVVKRVQAEMDCGCDLPQVNEPDDVPTVCAVVQSFNNEPNIEKIAHALVTNPAIEEIIVCEDGSSDESLERWTEQLREIKHFVIVSNNYSTARCYNRAMRLSSADFFILMQADDLPPEVEASHDDMELTMTTDNWVTHALMLFNADGNLGVLSGFIGQLWDKSGAYEFGEQMSNPRNTPQRNTLRIPFLSPRTLHPFMYCECAWASPLFIRAKSLRRMGGLDISLEKVHGQEVWPYCVLSYAAWTAGYRVGVFDSEFRRGIKANNSTSAPAKIEFQAVTRERANSVCDSRYDRQYIHSYVVMINGQTLVQRFQDD